MKLLKLSVSNCRNTKLRSRHIIWCIKINNEIINYYPIRPMKLLKSSSLLFRMNRIKISTNTPIHIVVVQNKMRQKSSKFLFSRRIIWCIKINNDKILTGKNHLPFNNQNMSEIYSKFQTCSVFSFDKFYT